MQAKWIGYVTDKNFDESDPFILHGARAPYLRKSFSLQEKRIKRAELKITSLGIYKAFINGKAVGNEFFAPGWTTYDKRILVQTYDVTTHLKKENAIAVALGDGWYVGYLCILGRNRYGKYPLELLAELSVTYEDGETDVIATDETWKGGEGAIGVNDFLYGEEFDARKPHTEISLNSFDDSDWERVQLCADKSERLSSFDCEPVRIVQTLPSVRLYETQTGTIYDFKQNFAGVVRIVCKGEVGARVRIRHGEVLNLDGTLYTDNLRTAKAQDTYILGGKGVEEYIPTFTYHGFRYAEITVEGNVDLLEVVGCALTSDIPQIGNVETDNALVNQLFSNILWGQRSNFLELPTDCPQRNERMGWSGDTQVFSRTGMYNADAERFYEKQMMRIDDDRKGGEIPDVVPFFGIVPHDSCGWREVAIVVPYNLWQMYGNTDVIVRYKDLLEAFAERQLSTMHNYLWDKTYYGDWLNVEQETEPTVLATAMQAIVMRMLAEMFDAVGFGGKKYYDVYENIKRAYRQTFVDEYGKIKGNGDTQAGYAVAYSAGLITKEEAKRNLYAALERKDFHIHCGFVAIRFVLPVLCEVGLQDVAYRLLTNETYPSWGYSIVNGATTVWERWNSYTIKDGFADIEMNSFNHYSLGSCGEWYYEYMLGIQPAEAGFKRLRIKPYIDKTGKITAAKGRYDSRNGRIEVEWHVQDGEAEIIVQKPESMGAEFCFDNIKAIEQDGKSTVAFNAYAKTTKVIVRL